MTERDELLARIRASPDDDDLRRVLADWLLERGDVRGELIQIQLEKHAGRGNDKTQKRILRRERELLRGDRSAFLDGLNDDAIVVRATETVFERGFLAECACDAWSFPTVAEHPAWATVRALAFEYWIHGSRLASAESLVRWLGVAKSARSIDGVPPDVALAFARDARPAIEHLSLASALGAVDDAGSGLVRADGDRVAVAPFDGPGLASLKRFGVRSMVARDGAARMAPWTEWLHTMPFLSRLEELEVDGAVPLGDALAWADSHARELRRLVVMHDARVERRYRFGWHIALARDAAGRLSRLEAIWWAPERPSLHQLLLALESLPPDVLTEVKIVHAGKSVGFDVILRLRPALARQPRVDHVATGFLELAR
jgi:uncharacterized protein (TIGR02996 family)